MARILKTVLFLYMAVCFTLPAWGAKRDLDKQYEKARFRIGTVAFQAYIADTDKRRSEGLMYIEAAQLPQDTGMLFVFEREQILSFWMKNTLIPLNIGFFNAKGELLEDQEMVPARSLIAIDIPSYASRAPAVFALEMNKGWFTKNGIKTGAKLDLLSSVSSPLLKTKLPASK